VSIFLPFFTRHCLLEGLIITLQMKITGKINTDRVDYAIKKILDNLLEEIICITEGKQNQTTMGICQNLLQCQSACDVSITNSTSSLTIG